MSSSGINSSGSDPSPHGIQFDRAEYAGGSSVPVCCQCGQAVASEYHHCDGRIFCGPCRSRLETSLTHLREQGHVWRALLYGLAAAVPGALLFYAVSALTGYEFGLIAILAGYLVGKAVRKGSGSLGGRRFQVMAVILTYISVTGSYAPSLARASIAAAEKAQRQEEPQGQSPVSESKVRHIGYVRFSALMFLLALAYPFLSLPHNVLGLVILGIALWEAWKLNRRVNVVFSGPFAVGTPHLDASA